MSKSIERPRYVWHRAETVPGLPKGAVWNEWPGKTDTLLVVHQWLDDQSRHGKYDEATDSWGPAMVWSVYEYVWDEDLGEYDYDDGHLGGDFRTLREAKIEAEQDYLIPALEARQAAKTG